jgi:O-antigen/teichoic acid export membrane protein
MIAMRFARNSMYGAIAGASAAVGNLASAVIIARLLGADGMGAVSYAVWLVLSITPVIECGIPAAVSRYVPQMRGAGEDRAAEELAARLMASLARASVVAAVAAVILVVGMRYWGGASSHAEQVFRGLFGSIFYGMPMLLAAYAIVQSISAFSYAYLRGKQQFDTAAKLAAISVLVQLSGVVLGSIFYGAPGAVAGYAAGQIIPALACAGLLWKSTGVRTAIAPRVRRYSAFAWAANIANTFVWARIEMFFLAFFWGEASVGLLAVALALANFATQPPLLMTSGVLSLVAEQNGRGDRAGMQLAYSGGTTLLCALVLPASFCMAAVMPVLLPLVYGQAFAPAVPAAALLVCVAGISVAGSMATNLVYAAERSDFVFYASASGGVCAIAAGFALVPEWGLMGAAIGRALVQLSLVAAGTLFVWRRLGFHASIRSLARIVVASAVAALVAAATVLLVAAPLSLAVALVLGSATYLYLLMALRAFSASEFELMSKAVRALPRPFARVGERAVSLFALGAAGMPSMGWLRGE